LISAYIEKLLIFGLFRGARESAKWFRLSRHRT